jgi:hypothetical protein
MRKFGARGGRLKKFIGGFLSFLFYIIYFVNFFFSKGVMDGWNFWENGPVFLKKNMEFHIA